MKSSRQYSLVPSLFLLFALLRPATATISRSDPLFQEHARCDYLIIVPGQEGFREEVEPLARQKRRRGLSTCVETVERISAHYPGHDLPQKIRACIREYWEIQGVMWVLLAGDYEKIPARTLRAMQEEHLADTQEITSDVYYACLEGEWDTNQDGIFGNEPSVAYYSPVCGYNDQHEYECRGIRQNQYGYDLLYDVYLGRLPASTPGELRIMVQKVLRYSDHTGFEPHNEVLLFSPQIHSTVYMPQTDRPIDDMSRFWHYDILPLLKQVHSPFATSHMVELYEDRLDSLDGHIHDDSVRITPGALASALNRDPNLVLFSAHGSPDVIRITSLPIVDGPNFTREDVSALQGNGLSNFISISCGVMQMQPESQTCFAKSLLVNPRGGAVSYAGSAGTEYLKTSTAHMRQAIALLNAPDVRRVSRAFYLSGLSEGVWKRFVFQYWGDPEMELRTPASSGLGRVSLNACNLQDSTLHISLSPARDSVLVCATDQRQFVKKAYTRHGTVSLPVPLYVLPELQLFANGDTLASNMSTAIRRNTSEKALSSGSTPFPFGVQVSHGRILLKKTSPSLNARPLTLYTAAGRVVQKALLPGGLTGWTSSRLPAGMYFITIGKARLPACLVP